MHVFFFLKVHFISYWNCLKKSKPKLVEPLQELCGIFTNVPIMQPWFLPHPCAPAKHPCCHWNCGTSRNWINLPGTSSRSVYEQDLHKRPIGSARPWLTPASGRQLAHTYRSGQQRVKGAQGGRRKPRATHPHMTVSTRRHHIFWRHTLAEQWVTSQMIWS